MPKIPQGKGKKAKHFAYDEAGMTAAREESARTGKPVEYSGAAMSKKKTRGKKK